MVALGRILVAGGGIAGLSAAIALRKAGFQADVFEQASELREAGAGVGLWSNAMASLDELGAGRSLRSSCQPLRIVAGSNARGRELSLIRLDALGTEFARAACHVVLRPKLLASLMDCLPSDAIHLGSRAIRVEDSGDRVRLHLESGRVEEGDLVIGADGLHSCVRPLVAGTDRVRYSGQTCFRGIARLRAPESGILREVQGRGQRGSVCPVDAETVYWWVAYNAPAERPVAPEERQRLLLERYRGWPFGLEAVIASTPSEAILQNDLVDRPPARTYARGRVVLTGDAAHPTTPNLGQGANMAIDDAIVLARALQRETSLSAAFDRYHRERLKRTRGIVTDSWRFGQMCLWKSATAVWLREIMVRITPSTVMRRILRSQILDSVGTIENPAA